MQLTREDDLPIILAVAGSGIVAIGSRILLQWPMVSFIALPLTTFFIFLLGLKLRKLSASNKYAVSILLGLFVSIFADAILQFSPGNDKFFVLGVALFGLTQMLYSIAFWSGKKFFKKDIIPFFIFFIYAMYFYLILSKKLEAQKLQYILIYLVLISIMGWRAAATLYRRVFTSAQKFLILIGALLFIISDTILAVNLFIKSLKLSSLWILVPYFTAQTFFALSIRHVKKKELA